MKCPDRTDVMEKLEQLADGIKCPVERYKYLIDYIDGLMVDIGDYNPSLFIDYYEDLIDNLGE